MRFTTRDILVRFVQIVAAVAFATAIDYATHALSDRFAVPEYYFRNKVIFGVLWACVGFYLFRRVRSAAYLSALVSGTIAVLLQFRYFLEGYATWFVFLFLFLHFLMFWLAFYLMLRLWPRTQH